MTMTKFPRNPFLSHQFLFVQGGSFADLTHLSSPPNVPILQTDNSPEPRTQRSLAPSKISCFFRINLPRSRLSLLPQCRASNFLKEVGNTT
jgi:hypothetical protein